jgi:ATP-dependent DNA helicase DinG
VLPEYRRVVIDEAHTIEHVAEDHFGIRISQFGLTYLLDRLYNPKKRKGLLAFHKQASATKDLIKKCRQAAQVFFAQVQAWHAHAGEENNGRCEAEFVENNLGPMLKELRLDLGNLSKGTPDEDDTFEFGRYADQLGALETDLKDFVLQQKDGCVYWVEIESNRRKQVLLRCAPLDVGPYLKRSLFDQYDSVVLTSATLSLGGSEKEGFGFFAGRVGLEEFESLQLGSPFDYEQQVRMYIEADLPEPKRAEFVEASCGAIKKYLLKSDGRAFVADGRLDGRTADDAFGPGGKDGSGTAAGGIQNGHAQRSVWNRQFLAGGGCARGEFVQCDYRQAAVCGPEPPVDRRTH